MESWLNLQMDRQPDETTCGPTCLHAVYRYYRDPIDLGEVLTDIPRLYDGGTLAVFLACHALRRGYQVRIYTYNLLVFDPTWFNSSETDIAERLVAQARYKEDPKLRSATEGYLEFLRLGGELYLEDLTPGLIRKFLYRSTPILTGLSATYLYRSPREVASKNEHSDIRGEPSGHFVVLCGYDKVKREVLVADPLFPNPLSESHMYSVGIARVICSILLGIVTYDANLLIIEPK